MWAETYKWTRAEGWGAKVVPAEDSANLVFYFGSPACLAEPRCFAAVRERFPRALLLGCSTGGEILEGEVLDDSLVVAAASFQHTRLDSAEEQIQDSRDSYAAGERLGRKLACGGLRAVFVLSDGTMVNGSELVRGLKAAVGPEVVLTGGLAGDGPDFRCTLVGGRSSPARGVIAAVGLAGDALRVGHGSMGGWEPFGPERLVTRSAGHVLYELDGKPALDLYKRYLGAEAERLPASALLFPLSIRRAGGEELVRTVLNVDEAARSMTFAGDVPEGAAVQLMRASFSALVEGASGAAEAAARMSRGKLALLVSCIGRRLLMGQRISDEVEAVADVIGEQCARVGFYSYGEISPFNQGASCELHNQTMTVTTFDEA